jgi:hypothetical protein
MLTEKNELEHFLKQELPLLLDKLSPDLSPLWGSMNVHQMVEHLGFTFLMSTGKLKVHFTSEPEKIPVLKRFVMSSRELPRLFKNPLLPEQPIPVSTSSLTEAKKALLQTVDYFFEYYRQKPDAVHLHNVFGELNYHEWLITHYKHIRHHLGQFGVGF